MKKLLSLILIFSLTNLLFISCNKDQKEDPGSPPELPPYESMATDFSHFTSSADKENPLVSNYQYAAINVGVFNLILTVTLAVPVAAFYHSFGVDARYLEDATWEWANDYEVLSATYHSRLTGKISTDRVLWAMYISKDGIGAFEEFEWYQGYSLLDGSSGQWTLNHSQQYPDALLRIDWQKSGEDIGEISYTNVREHNNNGSVNTAYGSSIVAGKTEGELDAYYNIHLSDSNQEVFIEWSTSSYHGRVKNDQYFDTSGWHCWDSLGHNIICN